MPRGARLDAPGVLHHVMVRGIERRTIWTAATGPTLWLAWRTWAAFYFAGLRLGMERAPKAK